MLKFKFEKLVRDKIVDTQIMSGARPHYRILDKNEYINAIVEKISEEAREIVTASEHEIAAEIADVQQALDDLIVKLGITRETIAKAQQAKTTKAGAFKKGIYIEYVEVDDHDKWVAYYRKNSDRYPEIN